MKRLLAMVLALVMVISLFAGCASDNGSKAPDNGNSTSGGQTSSAGTDAAKSGLKLLEGPFPLVEEKTTLRFFKGVSSYNGPWNELELVKDLEQRTNVHIEMEEVPGEVLTEKFQLAVSSGNLPDVFMNIVSPDQEASLGPDGILIPLGDLIAEYAPHIQKRYEENPAMKKAATALDGNIYGPGTLVRTLTQGAYKTYINMDWLSAAGMNMPKSMDDFMAYLRYVRDHDMNGNGNAKDEIPFLDMPGTDGFSAFDGVGLAWFGEVISPSNPLINVKAGKVSFIPASEGFKVYTRWMKSLIDEGLAPVEMVTSTLDEQLAQVNSGVVGCSTLLTRAPEPQKFVSVMPPLTTDVNKTQMAPPVEYVSTGGFAITSACKYPELAIKWIDLFYRNEEESVDGFNGIAMWNGREGVDWEYTDSSKTSFRYLFKPEGDLTTWLTYLKRKGVGSAQGCFIWFNAASEDPYLAWVSEGNKNNYYPYMIQDTVLPAGVRFTNDEAKELSLIINDLSTYVFEFRAKYLTGQVGEGDWAAYEAQLKQIGLEKYMNMLQAAYERYLAL